MSISRRMRSARCRIAAPILLLAALVAGGCSIPSDSSAQRIDTSLLPQLGPTPDSCDNLEDANPVKIPIYFVTGQEETTRIVAPLERDVDRPVTPQGALTRLFDCPPTEVEQEKGFTTQVPVTSLEQFIEIDGQRKLYEIHLSELRTREGEKVDELNKLAIAQIVFTLTNPDLREAVEGVRFVIDGEPKAANTDGATKSPDEFVMREDFTVTQPTTTTTTTSTTTTVAPTTTVPAPSTTAG